MKGAIITMKKKLWLILLLFMLFACSNKTKSPFIEDEEGHKMYKNEDGIYVKNDWYEIDGNKYYFDGNGYLVVNQWVNDEYYVDENGKMKTNYWKEAGDKTYYLGEDGKYYKKGKFNINGKEYMFDDKGELLKGILDDNGEAFVADKRGVIIKEEGPIEVGDKECYVNSDGKLAKNEWKNVKGIEKYYGDDYYRVVEGYAIAKHDSISTQSDVTVDWNYIDKEGNIVKDDWVEDKSLGKWCYANEKGVLLSNTWKTYNDEDYYFDQDCYMVTNNFVDGSYYVDENGKKVKNMEMVIHGITYSFDANGKSNKKVIIKTENANWKVDIYSDTYQKYISGIYYYDTTFINSKSYTSYNTTRYYASVVIDSSNAKIYFRNRTTKKNVKIYSSDVFLTVKVNDTKVISSERISRVSDEFLILTQNQKNILLNSLLKDYNNIKISIVDAWGDEIGMDYYDFEFDSTGFSEVYPSL